MEYLVDSSIVSIGNDIRQYILAGDYFSKESFIAEVGSRLLICIAVAQ
jgi:hypothetical protein